MKKVTASVVCLLTCLFSSIAVAQTAASPDLASADWSVTQTQILNSEPKDAVWKFINNMLGLGLGKLCKFKFVDLRHSEELSLVVSYDAGGTADCNDVEIFDKVQAGIEDYNLSDAGISYFESIEDISGDGNSELILGAAFASAGIDHCTATWPVIYAWTGTDYSDVSSHYKRFYEGHLASLQKDIDAAEVQEEHAEPRVAHQDAPVKSQPIGVAVLISPPSPPAPALADSERLDCTKAEAAKIERFLGTSSTAGMSDAIRWAESNNPDDRSFAIDVLADIGTPQAIEDLRTLSNDSDWTVARAAKNALAAGTPPVVDPTIQGELLTPNVGNPPAK